MIRLLALGGTGALLILGVVQGATEFLPVSSSGHLVLMSAWLGMHDEGNLSREIALHFGTLVAVILFCWRDLMAMLSKGSGGLWRLVIGSTIITGVSAVLVRDIVETKLAHPAGAGIGLLVTSLLLIVVAPRNDERQTKTLADGTYLDAVLLGMFQSLALMPGISRAGATIVAALLLGFRRHDAVRIAFLMSIPVVGGAVVLSVAEGLKNGEPLVATEPSMIAAMALACVVGLLCLRFISVRVDAASLRMFGLYTLVVGLAAILTS